MRLVSSFALGLALAAVPQVVSFAEPADTALPTTIARELLGDLDAAIAARSMDAILALHSITGPEDRARLEREYQQLLDMPAGLVCVHHLADVEGDAVGAVAKVLRRVSWNENGRDQSTADWLALSFELTDGEGLIADDAPLEYARPVHMELEVTIDPGGGTLEVVCSMKIELLDAACDRLVLNLNRGLSIDAISAGGEQLPHERTGSMVIVGTEAIRGLGETLELTLRYGGALFNEAQDLGYSNASIDPECSFASWLSSWYPQLWGTDGKSPGTLRFRFPEGLVAVSNGALVGDETRGGKAEYVFRVEEPAYYSFAVGRYGVSRREVDGVEVTTHFLFGNEDKRDWYLENLCSVLDYYRTELYGMYPYGRCSMVEIPSRIMGRSGGSSEQGLFFFPDIALEDEYFSLPVIAHELGHAYWGNWVVGEGAFMSEGLAQASCALCLEHMLGGNVMRSFLEYGSHDSFQSAALYFASVEGDSVRDLALGAQAPPSQLMDLHFLSNTKGVCVLVMLRDMLGADAFGRALRSAVAKHAHTRMTVEQLQGEFELASGLDLGPFFEQWFDRTGAPEITLDYEATPTGAGFRVTGTVRQTDPCYDGPIEIDICGREAHRTLTLSVSGRETVFSDETTFEPVAVVLDPDFRVFRKTNEFASLGDFGAAFWGYLAGDFDRAEELLLRQLDATPDNALSRFWLADLYERFRRDHRAAAAHLTRLVAGGAQGCGSPLLWGRAMISLGNAYDVMQDREKAVDCYGRVLEQDGTGLFHGLAARYLEMPYLAPPPPPPPPPPPVDESD